MLSLDEHYVKKDLQKNCLVDFDGKAAKYGFFKTYLLECESENKVQEDVLDLLFKDDDFLKVVLNKDDQSDPPMIYFDEIGVIESIPEDANDEGTIWYLEKKWWQFWKD